MSTVIVEPQGAVFRLRLNRPERLNVLNYDLIGELLDGLERADADPQARVVVISGEGRAFCAGDDLKGMGEVGDRRWEGRKLVDGAPLPQQALIAALRSFAKPVVAAMHGHALGMGLDMALACDIRLCSPTARMRADSWRTARAVQFLGRNAGTDGLEGGTSLKAREALELGLVSQVSHGETARA